MEVSYFARNMYETETVTLGLCYIYTNIQGLFVLTVGYIDMTTYPVIKYYYIIERAYFIHRMFILIMSTLSFLLFLYSIMEV